MSRPKGDEPKQADVVYSLMAEDEFTYDQDNNLLVITTSQNGKKLIINPNGDRYKGIISNRYMSNYGEVMDIKHHKAAVFVKYGETTKKTELYIRIAGDNIGTPEAVIYYDLCNDGEAVQIKPSKDGSGVSIIERPLKFKDLNMCGEQVKPDLNAKISDIERFYDHIKIKPPNIVDGNEQQDLDADSVTDIVKARKKVLLTWVIYSLLPDTKDYPLIRPGIKLSGQPGSGKTFNTKKLAAIPDPIKSEVVRKPDDIESLGLSLYQRWIPCFDNVKEVSDVESDMFCQAATGITTTKRKRFSDEDMIGNSFYRSCILNGISDILTRPDAADRYIPIDLQRLEGKENDLPPVMMKRFYRDMPAMFGAALKILSITLDKIAGELPETTKGHRLIQFLTIGRAINDIIEPGSADLFENTFIDMMESQETSMLDVNIAARLVADYVNKYGTAKYTEVSYKDLRANILKWIEKESSDKDSDYKQLHKMQVKDFKREITTFAKNLKSAGVDIVPVDPTPGATSGRYATYRLRYRVKPVTKTE